MVVAVFLFTSGRQGVAIDWRTHARSGVPVTLVTLTIAAAWLFATN